MLAFALQLVSSGPCSAQPTSDAELPGLEPFVDGLVAQSLVAERVGGAQVAVVRDGRVLLLKGYGLAAVQPPRAVDPARSLFRLGSVSKTFVWIALMQLAERGKLQLTDPINRHLPADLAIPDQGFTRPIRVLDLMNHTAGFEEVPSPSDPFDDAALRSARVELQRHRPARVREPGWLLSYSNYGANLAGQLVAQVAGVDFETYVEQHILRPLGMEHSSFREAYGPRAPAGLPAPLSEALRPDRAYGLEWVNGRFEQLPHEHILPHAAAGGVVSTAADMARYMSALLDPARLAHAGVLGLDGSRELRSLSFRGAPGLEGVHHGFFDNAGGRSVIGHANLWHGGHVAHYYADLTLFPELGLGIFVAANSNTAGKLVSGLREQIVSRYFPSSLAQPSPQAVSEQDMRQYAGSYRTTRRTYQRAGATLSIGAVSELRATPEGLVVTGPGAGESALFRPIGRDLFQKAGADTKLAFLRDARGNVTHSIGTLQTAERVGVWDSMRWLYACMASALVACGGILLDARRRRQLRPAEPALERRLARVIVGLAAGWLVTLGLLAICDVGLRAGIIQDPFSERAQPWVRALLIWVGITAAWTGIAVALLPALWRRTGWSRGRRAGLTLALSVLAVLVATLRFWHIVGLDYP